MVPFIIDKVDFYYYSGTCFGYNSVANTAEVGVSFREPIFVPFRFCFGFLLFCPSLCFLFCLAFSAVSFRGFFSSCPLWLLFVCLWLPLLFVLLILVAAFFLLSPSLGVFTCPSHHQEITHNFCSSI